uniref:uncharacterized protein LOC100895059 n=1 Tax=Callithrix jacchus TaxID=9483 RepID=UPI0023DD416C|nr:uncharacterized protein LOC100895059 [Callithrix jacchus]
MSGRRSAPSPEGAGAAAFSREPPEPRENCAGEGAGAERRRRGGGPDRVWEGRGTAPQQPPPPPRARLNFLYSPERYQPPAPRVLPRTPQGWTHRRVGGRLLQAARFYRAEANLAAQPAPQPFSREPGEADEEAAAAAAAVPTVAATAPRLAPSLALAAPLA